MNYKSDSMSIYKHCQNINGYLPSPSIVIQNTSKNTLSKASSISFQDILNETIKDPIEILLNNDHNILLLSQQHKNYIKELDNAKVHHSNEWKTIMKNEIAYKIYPFDNPSKYEHRKMMQNNMNRGDCLSSSDIKKTYLLLETNYFNESEDLWVNYFKKSKGSFCYVNTDVQKRKEISKYGDFKFPSQRHDVNKRKRVKNPHSCKSQIKLTSCNLYDKFCDLGSVTKFNTFLNKMQTEQQIRDVYNAVMFKPLAKASNTYAKNTPSFINRKKRYKEIIQTNKKIVNKILNARSTIPKSRI